MKRERLPYSTKAIRKGVSLPDQGISGRDEQKASLNLKSATRQKFTNRKGLLSFSWYLQTLLWNGFNQINRLLSK